MSITLGIDSVCYLHTMKSKKLDLLGYLDKAVEYIVGAVQMDPLWPSQNLDLTTKSLQYLGKLLDERKLQIVVKGNSSGLGSLANPIEASASDIEIFRAKIEAASVLGSPIVRIVTRAYPYPTSHNKFPSKVPRWKVIGWVVDNLRKLIEYAEAKSVRLVIENHGDLRIAEIEHILKEVNSPFLGVQFDLLEQVAIFEDPNKAAERLLPHAFTIHWNDAYPQLSNSGICIKACPPGEGIIDLNRSFQGISSLERDIFIFTAFQAESEESEDLLVKAYVDDLHNRLSHIRSNS